MKLNQRNKEGIKHGYWEEYYYNGNLFYKGNYHNGRQIGYWTLYHANGNFWSKGNFDNGKHAGYWEWYNDDGELKEQIFYS